MKHPTTIIGYTDSMQDLAKEVAMLRYDKLHEFIIAFAQKIAEDGHKDMASGKERLGGALLNAAGHLYEAQACFNEVSFICKPFNE